MRSFLSLSGRPRLRVRLHVPPAGERGHQAEDPRRLDVAGEHGVALGQLPQRPGGNHARGRRGMVMLFILLYLYANLMLSTVLLHIK